MLTLIFYLPNADEPQDQDEKVGEEQFYPELFILALVAVDEELLALADPHSETKVRQALGT
jgi:hypothetical protein